MSELHIPIEGGPYPAKPIVVDVCEGSIEINVDQVTEPEFRRFSLTTSEARSLASALRHFANEVDHGRS